MDKKYKLRIFIYGKEALNDIKYICKTIDTKFIKDYKYKVKPYCSIDKESGWEYFIFSREIDKDGNEAIKKYLNDHYKAENIIKADNEYKKIIKKHQDYIYNELNEKISKVLLEYLNFYDILVILVDNLLDENSKTAFIFFQGFTKNNCQQPFILFLTKKDNNPNILDLFQFVTNEFFDKRNVYAKKFPANDKEKENIHNFFLKCMYYYNGVRDCENDVQVHTFNILVCGVAGVGKSSFINQFLKEKIAKEGECLVKSHKINNYIHPEYPIRLYDTPGFESDDTIKMVKKTIDDFENDIKESKNHIDLVLYFHELKLKSFLSLEIDYIKYLLKKIRGLFLFLMILKIIIKVNK